MINYAKTEEIRVNNKIDRPITTENRQIKWVTDFCYLGSIVSENGGATQDSRRIQKAQGAFAKLRKSWQSTLMNRIRSRDKSLQTPCKLYSKNWIRKGWLNGKGETCPCA
jgi:hypothetical protein